MTLFFPIYLPVVKKLSVNHQFIAPSLYNQITQLIFITDIIKPKIKCTTLFGTLGSRGYFFLIDTEAAALTQGAEAKKVFFFSSALCASLTRLRREPSVSIRKKYPLEPRVAFWRHAFFVRGQAFSVEIFDRSRSGCQVIRLRAGDDFGGPSGQALPLPSRVVSPSRALVLSCAHYFQAPATQATVKWQIELGSEEFRVNK